MHGVRIRGPLRVALGRVPRLRLVLPVGGILPQCLDDLWRRYGDTPYLSCQPCSATSNSNLKSTRNSRPSQYL